MPRALAIAAHPDDIEFVMAGTLLQLGERGWDIHYMNVSSGDLGSMTMGRAETRRVRQCESRRAAEALGATWHGPVAHDLQVFYIDRTLRRVAAVVRKVEPTVILTHSPEDYMEDHMNVSRLAVTAAFSRGMPNYRTSPQRPPAQVPVTIYHASPHGLRDGLRRRIVPGAFVDTTRVHAMKRAALACHASQKDWLDTTQGMDSYLVSMDEFSEEHGKLAGSFSHAEGWRRHSHLGFCAPEADPLRDALGELYRLNSEYERLLDREV